MIDIDKLRRLVQAATPGPWVAAGPSFGESLPKYLNEVVVDREGDEDDGYSICHTPIGLDQECSDDMAFIAEANPLTIEELLDRLEAAEQERDWHAERCQDAMTECDALRAKIERMERQEPAGVVQWIKGWPVVNAHDGVILEPNKPLYTLPGAQPAPSVPPELEPNGMYDGNHHYASGWNDCRAAMLEAQPEAKP